MQDANTEASFPVSESTEVGQTPADSEIGYAASMTTTEALFRANRFGGRTDVLNVISLDASSDAACASF
ncbi:MAG: hypothetical protein MI861_00760 [Pirellulales bacterium]|nr:hypothetical protein [Pirellulales bacterium]